MTQATSKYLRPRASASPQRASKVVTSDTQFSKLQINTVFKRLSEPATAEPRFLHATEVNATRRCVGGPFTTTSAGRYEGGRMADALESACRATLRKQIQNLALLQADWNGYGAPAPARKTVALSLQLLALASDEGILPSTFFPEPAGGLGATFLPWTQEDTSQQQSDIYATIGFENDSSAALMIADRAKAEIHSEDILADDASLRAALRRIKDRFED